MNAMPRMTAKPRKTLADVDLLPPETRAELIQGEIVMSPTPTPRHQLIVGRLFAPLHAVVTSTKWGVVFPAPLDVVLGQDLFEPDIAGVAAGRLSIVGRRIEGAPDLAVEVLSPSTHDRDRFVKREAYARAGVGEYWIVDPDASTVEVFAGRAGRFVPAGYYGADEILRSPLLVPLEIPLAAVFAPMQA
jgi:Uma2 family endonuclease